MTATGYVRPRKVIEAQSCIAVEITKISRIWPFLNVGYRPEVGIRQHRISPHTGEL
jgi:hypothetical protein